MPFGQVTNLASAQAADAERKRQRELATVAREQEQDALLRKLQAGDLAETEATSPARLLELKGNVYLKPEVRRDAEQHAFLDQNARERQTRQAQARQASLGRRAEALAVPGPTATERASEMAAPLGRFAYDAPMREDLPELRQMRAGFDRDVSRETRPIYTDAPNAGRERRPNPDGITVGGDGPETMPYAGGLAELAGIDVPRAAIRQEFGGTAPDTVLRFSDRKEPGMRLYQGRNGRARDVGAPGGGLIEATRGEPETGITPQGLLDQLITETERLPLTDRETAGAIAAARPEWDVRAANIADPNAIEQEILLAVGRGDIPNEVGNDLLARYAGIARQVTKAESGEFVPGSFQEILQPSALAGPPAPAPGEAEARLRSPGPDPAAAEAEAAAATQDARQAPPDGPGSTRSPALAAESEAAGAAPTRQPRAPQARSQVETGGRGESGLAGLVADYQAFREGEGRAGYGESGPAGFAKDLAAFYGGRLPQDILEALLGFGTGRIAGGVGRQLGGLRAVENALGKF